MESFPRQMTQTTSIVVSAVVEMIDSYRISLTSCQLIAQSILTVIEFPQKEQDHDNNFSLLFRNDRVDD